jgi:hypothetical protein
MAQSNTSPLISRSPCLDGSTRTIDWTPIIREHAPRPGQVSDLRVQRVTANDLEAVLSYTVNGVLLCMDVSYLRHLPGDDSTTGDVLWLNLPSGEESCITEEERTTVIETSVSGDEVREPFPQLVNLAPIVLDGQRLLALMQQVYREVA